MTAATSVAVERRRYGWRWRWFVVTTYDSSWHPWVRRVVGPMGKRAARHVAAREWDRVRAREAGRS